MLLSARGVVAATVFVGTAFIGMGLNTAPAFAEEAETLSDITVTGRAQFTTDYRFRGVSMSAGDPAIQGEIAVEHKSGFYVGAFGSSIDMPEAGFGTSEFEIFGGWKHEVASGLTADVGMTYFAYPGGHGEPTEFWQPYASVTGEMGPAKLKVGVAYAWKQDSLPIVMDRTKGDNLYISGDLDVAIPHTPLTAIGHFGYTDGVLAPGYYETGDRTGFDWSIGAAAPIYGPLSLSVSYVGVTGRTIDGLTDDAIVATLTASF